LIRVSVANNRSHPEAAPINHNQPFDEVTFSAQTLPKNADVQALAEEISARFWIHEQMSIHFLFSYEK